MWIVTLVNAHLVKAKQVYFEFANERDAKQFADDGNAELQEEGWDLDEIEYIVEFKE